MSYNEKINFLFDQTGLTQEEFGELIGMSQVMVSRYLKSNKPNLNFLIAISKHYAVDYNYLLNDKVSTIDKVEESENFYEKPPLTLIREIKDRVKILEDWHITATKKN